MAHIQKLGMMNMVREERTKLTTIAKELITLLDNIKNDAGLDNTKYTEVSRKTLDLLNPLTNIAGFCDKDSQVRIRKVTELVTMYIGETVNFHSLRKVCGLAVGLQVDFNRYPFLITEFDINILSDEFKHAFKK